MQTINVFINHNEFSSQDTEKLISSLTLNDSSVRWTVTDALGDADIIATHVDSSKLDFGQQVSFKNFENFADDLNLAMMKGDVVVPTTLGRQLLTSTLARSEQNFMKIRNNNPLHLSESQMPDPELVSSKEKFAAWAIHPSKLKALVPDLKRVMDSRFVNSLQRNIPHYVALAPLDSSYKEMYPDIPKSASEHLDRVEKAKEKIEKLGISVPATNMAMNQLNLGIPFPGGLNREAQNLTPPSELFMECARHVGNIMLRGAAYAYNDNPKDFESFSVRVGTKKDNFQGAAIPSRSHTVRQTYWSIAENSSEGLFHFTKYNFPTVAGLRRQSNSGKTRVSFLLDRTGYLARSRVTDSIDLNGKPILSYDRDASEGVPITDNGDEGARCRIVDNLWSAQNDATLPLPALLAEFKDYHYKAIFQQDFEIMSRFVPDSIEFEEFWREGYEENAWVRELALKRGFEDFDSLLKYMRDEGQVVACGDVENFDGNSNHEIVFGFFQFIMSQKVYQATEQMWHADKIGVYASSDGSPVYYYVACNAQDTDPKGVSELIKKTKNYMSHVPSGMGPTAQAGRGVVPTVLCEIVIQLYPEAKEFILSLPPERNSKFSALSALMNSAGDDHNLGLLILWLITGKSQDVIYDEIMDAFKKYKTLIITPEIPKMNAGFLFHDNEKGRLKAVSLSPSRGFGNMVFPERPRSAIGLHASMMNYLASTVGTPAEEDMLQLAEIILKDIFRFEDLDHLAECAAADQEWIDQNANLMPAVDRLAALLNIPINDLEWKYTFDDLLDLGAPASLVNEYRRPIPSSLTKGPFNFLNEDSIKQLAAQLSE